jgi:serine/threonine-protein kinase
MANVYLAVSHSQNAVSKLVVLKALLPDLACDPSALTAFLDEARLAAQLNHGNVVQTYEIGTEGDRHVIVMEYLEGQSLANIIKRSAARGNALPLAFQLRIILSVLEGLQYAHELASYDGAPLMLVHRDVSPQNVFVTYDGQVKVLDFGIAKATTSTVHTATGMVKGKISYMSPEQMLRRKVDRRADVYAVGCMLWAAVVEKKLWKDLSDVEIMRAVTNGEVPLPHTENPQCDAELARITMKALAFDSRERHQSAFELQEELEQFCEQRSIPNRPRDLGRYVSDLFADTRAALRAHVEQQLSRVTPAASARPVEEREPAAGDRSVEGSTFMATSTTNLLSTTATNRLARPSALHTRGGRLWVGFVLTLIVTAAVAWRMASGVREPAVVAQTEARKTPPIENATVQLRSSPGNAQLSLDGELLVGNPSTRVLRKDSKIHILRAEAEGYHAATAEFTSANESVVELKLEKLEPVVQQAPRATRRLTTNRKPSPASTAVNCAQPFFIDKDGIKKLRPACL